jgi:SAM-dependent methyltransferase
VQAHNWLVHRIVLDHLSKIIPRYARGRLIDIGCSNKPYKDLTKPVVDEHIGIDHSESLHDLKYVDIIADAYDTTVPDTSCDTILCTSVLEHLERPQESISEMYRILKPGGYVILSAPMIWHLHEEPRDFFRYTKYGLRYMFEESGFEIIEINPISGFVVTFTQELTYFLNYFKRSVFRYLIAGIQWSLQQMAYWLNKYDKTFQFTWLYIVVARKPNKID